MTKTYSETLEEHIRFLQGELDKAAVQAHRHSGVPPMDQIGSTIFQQMDVVQKWKPMVQHIKNAKEQTMCACHLEYAMRYIEALYGKEKKHPALPIVMPCIARMYD
jgi:hypothetical protein